MSPRLEYVASHTVHRHACVYVYVCVYVHVRCGYKGGAQQCTGKHACMYVHTCIYTCMNTPEGGRPEHVFIFLRDTVWV